MKNLSLMILFGFLLGGIAAAVLAPGTIAWYFEPPVEVGVNCRPATEWAMQKLLYAQVFGALLGGIIMALLSFFLRKKKTV